MGFIVFIERGKEMQPYGTDASGSDTYTTVLTSPSRVCRHLLISLGTGNDAVLSYDSGTTDSIYIKGGTSNLVLDDLVISGGSLIQGKNAVPASNYTNLRISIW